MPAGRLFRQLTTGRAPRPRHATRNRSFEKLETRDLLAADFHNAFSPLDVNDDGVIAPGDALSVVNYLNAFGAGPTDKVSPPPLLRVNTSADDFISPVDVLRVINQLNLGSNAGFLALRETPQTLARQGDRMVNLPTGEGRPTVSFVIRTRLDSTDTGVVGDVMNVFVVDPLDPSRTLLDGGQPGSPLLSITETGTTLTPGLATRQGERVQIDLASLAGTPRVQLRFQLLSLDGDSDSRAVIERVTSSLEAPRDGDLTFPGDATVDLGPGGPTEIVGFTPAPDVSVDVRRPHLVPQGGRLLAQLTATNHGEAHGRNLVAVIRGLPEGVQVPDAAGFTINGDPFLNLEPVVPRGGLRTGGSTHPLRFELLAGTLDPIDLDVAILSGGGNQPPVLDPVPPVTMRPGEVVTLPLSAADADGDALHFSVVPLPGQPPLPTMTLGQSGRLTLRPFPDQVGNFQFSVQASDGALSTAQTVTLDVQADPFTTTRLSGQVLSTDGSPLAGVPVEIGDVRGTTDAAGSFTLDLGQGPLAADALLVRGELLPGPETFPFIAEKLPLLLGRDVLPGVNNVVDRPIYLPPLDVANGRTIDPAEDVTVTTAAIPGAQVFVAAGSLRDPQGELFQGVLSITEVPRERTPAALPAGQVPDLVVTIQPGEMVFTQPAPLTLPNLSAAPPGTEADLFSINPLTGDFDVVGKGRVSADGTRIETVEGGIRNSSWHFFSILSNLLFGGGGDHHPDNGANLWGIKQEATSQVELHSGGLLERHDLVSYMSQNQTRSWSLVYDSLRADPRHAVHDVVRNPFGVNANLVMTAQVRHGNVTIDVPGGAAPELGPEPVFHFWRTGGNLVQSVDLSLLIDLEGQPTGVYQVETQSGQVFTNATGQPTNARFDNRQTVPIINVNGARGPFGAGWGLQGLEQLFVQPDGGVLLVDGGGEELLFDRPEDDGQPHRSPPGEFSTLRQQADGTFLRTTTDQTAFQYDPQGRLVSRTDRNGNRWQFVHEPRGIQRIIDPVGLETRFHYTGPHVTEVEDPAARVTRFEYDGAGNLVRIVDPDGSTRSFEYDEAHHMTAEVTPRGFRERIEYGFHGRVIQTIQRDGGIQRYEPAQTRGLLPAGQTTRFAQRPEALAVSEQAETRSTTPNGNLVVTQLDARGQVLRQRDLLGNLPRSVRDANNQIVEVFDARGNVERFDYDPRGNLLRLQDTISLRAEAARDPANRPGLLADPVLDLDFDNSRFSLPRPSLGDLDGDGHQDVAVAGITGDRVTVLFGDGNGRFSRRLELVQGINVRAVVTADLNGDGLLDLAMTSVNASITTGQLITRLGNGDGTFQDPIVRGTITSPYHLDAADFDGDGNLDLVVGNENGSGNVSLQRRVAIHFGAGDGTLENALTISTPQSFPIPRAADVDADGLPDLIVANKSTAAGTGLPRFSIHRNQGNRQFAAFSEIATNSTLFDFDLGDVNNDGRSDIVAVSQSDNRLITLLSDGQAGFQDRVVSNVAGLAGRVVQLLDANADGAPDLVSQAGGGLGVFLNDGTGTFTADSPITAVGNAQLTVGDLNADGRGDLIVLAPNKLQPLLQTDASGFPRGAELVQPFPFDEFELLDFNADQLPDLLVNNQLFLNLGERYAAPVTFNGMARFGASALADFNNDGVLDYAHMQNSVTSVVQLRVNLGTGDESGFQDDVEFQFNGFDSAARFLTAADLDGDGNTDLLYDRDLFQSGQRRDSILWSRGNGDGTFQPPVILGDQGNFSFNELFVLDLNGDQALDMIAGISLGSQSHMVLLNDGSETFTVTQVGFGGPVAVGDVNGDGHVDIVSPVNDTTAGTSDLSGFRFAPGDGTGNFGSPVEILLPRLMSQQGIEVGDVNGDDRPDVVTVDSFGGVARVYLADEAGMFTTHEISFAGGLARRVALADVDRDGDLDVLAGMDQNRVVTSLADTLVVQRNKTNSGGAGGTDDPDALDCGQGSCAVEFQYDPTFSQVTRLMSPLGATTLYAIDPTNGNALSEQRVVGEVDQGRGGDDAITSFTYDAAGQVLTRTDPSGAVTRNEYDPLGRLVRSILAEGTAVEARLQFEYDAAGNTTALIDERGNRVEFEYSLTNDLLVRRDPLGHETRFEYDPAGNVVRQIDALGREVLLSHDPLDRQIALTDPLGNVVGFACDEFGNLTSTTDENGNTTRHEYDLRRRLVRSIDALGGVTRYEYDEDDNLLAETDPRGNTRRYQYDARDRVVTMTDPAGFPSRHVYDLSDRPVKRIDALGRVERTEYDSLDRVVRVIQPNAAEFAFEYDAVGNLTGEIDPLGNESRRQYDARDRLTARIDPLGNITRFEYDAGNNLVTTVDALGRMTQVEYDALNRVVKTTDALGGESLSTYDAVGNTQETTNARGATTRYAYDAMNRLVAITDPLGGVQTREFDPAGNLVTVTDPLGRTDTFAYDDLNRKIRATDPQGFSVLTTYDAAGNLVASIDRLGRVTQFEYDPRDLIVRQVDPLGATSRFEYDAVANRVRSIDRNGNVTATSYDELDRPIRTVDAEGHVSLTEYDPAGQVVRQVDPLGREWRFEFDPLYRAVKQTDPLGGETRSRYDAVGNLVGMTDPLGRSFQYEYDALDRRTADVDPQGNRRLREYDPVGNLVRAVDALGNAWTHAFDLLDRPTRSTDPAGGVFAFTYDAAGQTEGIIDPAGRRTEFEYDPRGNTARIMAPLGESVVRQYDAQSNLVAESDALGNTTRYVYDPLDRRTSVLDARGGATRTEYDAEGNITAIVDPVGNRTTFEYDGLNRVVREVNPLGDQRTYEYDAAGNQTSRTDRLGRRREFAYDALNRQIAEQWFEPGASSATHAMQYAYDAAGQLTSASDANASYSYTYNPLGEVNSTRNAGTPGAPVVEFSLDYDANGHAIRLRESIDGVSAATIDYQRDPLGRIIRFQQSGDRAAEKRVDMVYNAAGELESIRRFSDLDGVDEVFTTEYRRDAQGFPTQVLHGSQAEPLHRIDLVYDQLGRITERTTGEGASRFTYDALGQLLTAEHPGLAGESRTYDQAGNRVGGELQVDASNRLARDTRFVYAYDANGNRVRQTDRDSGEVTDYAYDHRDRLVTVERRDAEGSVVLRASYAYDVFDLRIATLVDPDGDGPLASEATRYVWDEQQIGLVFDGQGNLLRRVLPAQSMDFILAEEQVPSGTVLWYAQDLFNNVTNLVGSDGLVVKHLAYDAFGNVTVDSNPGLIPLFQFAGRELDEETGLIYVRQHLYDPRAGLWTREDPASFLAGDANLYRFNGNSPINAVDPLGLGCDGFFSCIGSGLTSAATFVGTVTAGVADSVTFGLSTRAIGLVSPDTEASLRNSIVFNGTSIATSVATIFIPGNQLKLLSLANKVNNAGVGMGIKGFQALKNGSQVVGKTLLAGEQALNGVGAFLRLKHLDTFVKLQTVYGLGVAANVAIFGDNHDRANLALFGLLGFKLSGTIVEKVSKVKNQLIDDAFKVQSLTTTSKVVTNPGLVQTATRQSTQQQVANHGVNNKGQQTPGNATHPNPANASPDSQPVQPGGGQPQPGNATAPSQAVPDTPAQTGGSGGGKGSKPPQADDGFRETPDETFFKEIEALAKAKEQAKLDANQALHQQRLDTLRQIDEGTLAKTDPDVVKDLAKTDADVPELQGKSRGEVRINKFQLQHKLQTDPTFRNAFENNFVDKNSGVGLTEREQIIERALDFFAKPKTEAEKTNELVEFFQKVQADFDLRNNPFGFFDEF